MIKRALAVIFACLAIVGLAAGCGGGDDSTSSGGDSTSSGDSTSVDTTGSSGSAPTKAVFIKEADQVCEKTNTELLSELESYAAKNGISEDKEPTKAQETALYVDVVVPNIQRQGEELAELTPPEGEEQTIEEIVDTLDAGVKDAEANPEQLTEGKNPFADASAKAVDYGMKACGAEE